MKQMSLRLSRYPIRAGYKKTGTSSDAARDVESRAGQLRLKVLHELMHSEGTADEIAQRLGEDKLSIRPRCSELYAQNLIEESGERRKNESGKFATVWRVK